MKKKILLTVVILLILIMPLFTQSRPIMGYDKVTWGTSLADVRKAYNLSDSVSFYGVSDDPNIGYLVQNNISETIAERHFYFNKWNSNYYRLYRVVVIYNVEKGTQNIVVNLNNLLQQNFGKITHSWEENPKVTNLMNMGSMVVNITHIIYGTYSPELEVELINYRQSGRMLGIVQPTEDVNEVWYTWKKFRDSYEGQKLGL